MSRRDPYNPLYDSQPYEDLQGARQISPADLERFYKDQEVRELQRKASRKSRWSRKSLSVKSHHTNPSTGRASVKSNERISTERQSMDKDDGYSEKSNRGSSPQPPPSSLVSTPSFTRKQGEWNSAAPAYYDSFYELHNPTGPRFYFNHHLAKKGVSRLPLMSPGFHTTSTPGSVNSNLSTPPIKTPDGSTLTLPQRTRKISTNDNVDLLDITDPWGQNFHHDSRYDVGIERKQEPQRRTPPPSRTTSNRPSPSPLSQSTSAIDLAALDPSRNRSRRLSKRKTASFRGFFMGTDREPSDDAPVTESKPESKSSFQVVRPTRSVPATPISQTAPPSPLQGHTPSTTTVDKHASTSSVNVLPSLPLTSKREKRTSVLGKLAKRFTVMKKPMSSFISESTSELSSIAQDAKRASTPTLGQANAGRAASAPVLSTAPGLSNTSTVTQDPPRGDPEQRRKTDPMRRVPPPTFEGRSRPLSDIASSAFAPTDDDDDDKTMATMQPSIKDPNLDNRGSVDFSYDALPGLGRLTIANPDFPGSKPGTPVRSSLIVNSTSNLSSTSTATPRLDASSGDDAYLPPVGSVTPFNMPNNLFTGDTPRASMHVPDAQPANVDSVSISWPSITESQPSSVHVSVLGEDGEGDRTPTRRQSPEKRNLTVAVAYPSPRVEVLGDRTVAPVESVRKAGVSPSGDGSRSSDQEYRRPSFGNRTGSERSSSQELTRDRRSSPEKIHVRQLSPNQEYRPSSGDRTGSESSSSHDRRSSPEKIRTKQLYPDQEYRPSSSDRTGSERSSPQELTREQRSSPEKIRIREPSLDHEYRPSSDDRTGNERGNSQELMRDRRSSPEKIHVRQPSPTKKPGGSVNKEYERDRENGDYSRQRRGSDSNSPRPSPEKMRERRSSLSGREKERGRMKVEETYRLVRSGSKGDVFGATVTAEGQGWEIVEGSRRRRDKHNSSSPEKDGTRSPRKSRESRRESRNGDSLLPYARPNSSQDDYATPSSGVIGPARSGLHATSDSEKSAERPPLSRSSTTRTIPPPPPPKSTEPISDPQHTESPDLAEPKPRVSSLNTALPAPPLPSRRSAPQPLTPPTATTQPLNLNKKQPPPPQVTTSDQPLARAPNLHTTRPSSDISQSTDSTVLKAKEAWDADRFWKGKSTAFDSEVTGYSPPQGSSRARQAPQQQMEDWTQSWQEPSSQDDRTSTERWAAQPYSQEHTSGNIHGSGHTSYMMQAPFLHHEYGAPTVYAPFRPPRTPIPSFALEYEANSRRNPLPDPPQEAPHYNGGQDTQITTEYWKHYSGLATSS